MGLGRDGGAGVGARHPSPPLERITLTSTWLVTTANFTTFINVGGLDCCCGDLTIWRVERHVPELLFICRIIYTR